MASASEPIASERAVGPTAWRSIGSTIARHPRHLALGWLVLGLLAGAHGFVAAAGAVVAAPFAARRGTTALAMVACALVGAIVAHGRVTALSHSALASEAGHVVVGRATLLEPARRARFGRAAAIARLEGERVVLQGPGGPWIAAAVGSRVHVRGSVGSAVGVWRRRGLLVVLHADEIRLVRERRGGIAGAVDTVRARAERVRARGVPPAEGALLQGMVLGDDHLLPAALRDDFRAAGLTHLTAASGQNVMLLMALTTALTASLGLALRGRLAVALAMIVLYVPLAGGGPSIQRAGVMGAAGVMAGLVGRPASRWYALGAAAAITLAGDPFAFRDPGWQMSFAAVAAILAAGGRLRDRMVALRVPGPLAEAIALTLAAGLATAPIIAWHFHRLSLVSPLVNVLAVPAVAPVMWLGMVAATIGQAAPAAGAVLAAGAAVPAGYLVWLAHAAAAAPGALIAATAPAALLGAAGVAALAWWCTGSRLGRTFGGLRTRRAPVIAAVAAITAVGACGAWLGTRRRADATPPRQLRISFLDVGQGDATLLQDRQAAVLVDTGPPGAHVVARLRHAGVRRLDALVVTHAQIDHDGGAPSVLAALPVGLLLDGRDGIRSPVGDEIADAAARRHIRLITPAAGQALHAGRLVLRILWPPRESAAAHAGADPNARGIVSLVRDGGVSVLLAADVESDVLAGLDLSPVNVLKVSHHGSADAGLPALLARLRPAIAVVSVGAGNPYGHPAPPTLRALRRAVPHVYRTDRDGSVRIDDDDGVLEVRLHA